MYKVFAFIISATFCTSSLASSGLGPYSVVTGGISNNDSQATNYIITRDNQRVVFEANLSQALTLYSVPIAGGRPVALSQNNQQLDSNLTYRQVSITNNSQHVVYAQLTGGDDYSVFVSPINGSSSPTLLTENPSYWRLDDRGTGIYYIADNNPTQLRYIALSGGVSQVIAGLPTGIEVDQRLFPEDEPNNDFFSRNHRYDPNRHGEQVSDGDHLIVLGSDNNLYHYTYGQQASAFTKIETQSLGSVEHSSLKISPTNEYFLFLSAGRVNIASLSTGQLLKLASPHAVVDADFSPDGSRVLIVNNAGPDFRHDLYSIKPDGTGLVRLTPTQLNRYIEQIFYEVSNDNKNVFYTAFEISDAAIGGQTFVSPIDGSNPAKLLCNLCGVYKRDSRPRENSLEPITFYAGVHAVDSIGELYYYSESQEKLILLNFGAQYPTGQYHSLIIKHHYWDEAQNTLVFISNFIPSYQETVRTRVDTVYKVKFDVEVPKVTKLFETENNNCNPLQGLIRVAKPRSRLIMELARSDCEKTAYFKLSTTNGTLFQISNYKPRVTSRFLDLNLDMRIEGNDCLEYPWYRNELYRFQLRNPFIERNKDCLRSISPRGTHIMIPADRSGVGFWGLDLNNGLLVEEEDLCFPIKSKDDAVSLICF